MRRVLTIFLASPSDVGPERKLARDVVIELNTPLRDINWTIELLGWEDTLPGYGRPQALINTDIEQCDLFIGILWRRWGTPPDGQHKYTSGFEEEFALARSRNEEGSKPEIWLFFKQVEPEQAQDAGIQLQRVLGFRDEVARNRICLFKEFKNQEEWVALLRQQLLRHVLKLNKAVAAPPQGTAEYSQLSTAMVETRTEMAPLVGQQLRAFTEALQPCFKTGDIRDLDPRPVVSKSFFAARAWLLAHGASKILDNSVRVLPTHELNTLYKYRRQLHPTIQEREVIFDSLLGDSASVEPGWYWARESNPGVEHILFATLLSTDRDDIKKIALQLLRFSSGDDEAIPRLRQYLLRHELLAYPSDLHQDAWAFLIETVTPDDVEMLQTIGGASWVEPRLNWLKEWVNSGHEPERILLNGGDPNLFPFDWKERITADIPRLPTAALQALTSVNDRSMLSAAVGELTRRGIAVAKEIRERALSEHSLVDQMLGKKQSSVESDESRYARLYMLSNDALVAALSWVDVDSPIAYQILVERGGIDRQVVHKDIVSGFRRLYDSFAEPYLSRGDAGREMVAELAKYHDFITQNLSDKALKGLTANPLPEDAEIARSMLMDNPPKGPALRILSLVGTQEDLPGLLKAAETSFGREQSVALEGIWRLDNDPKVTFERMIVSEAPAVRRFAAWLLSDLGTTEARQIADGLLCNPDSEVRIAAATFLGETLEKAEAEQLLDRYVESETYYYNVVTWLDRFLYAPDFAVRAYRNQIRRPSSVTRRVATDDAWQSVG